ncbi:hypothetical protein K493DRAFT_408339 [Basidiobolus meristosporus CBS 931.73]|uniref:BCAS3 WD40 domain-containing protein n=1 Tax=Basidiobolus meristosporus CBS 931.73 TaxID=1314790 RepID=A0A1Y1Y6F7_9FUNG|nr:hypothetical protein K493DRAFT_408339 [Basidiobolus meristosporus CBS 931.73]|eukprot:ORX93592.1 hypothetical protein K493DRAFT_408339 [Basidiobolus meristosporus CBS 931.73]
MSPIAYQIRYPEPKGPIHSSRANIHEAPLWALPTRKDRFSALHLTGYGAFFQPSPPKTSRAASFKDGFQIWDTTESESIQEIISLRQQNQRVTCIRALPEPKLQENVLDEFKGYRTLIAVASEEPDANQQVTSRLDFFSLKTHSNIKTIDYSLEMLDDISCNDSSIVLTFKPNRLLLLSPYTLTSIAVLDDAAPNPMTDGPVHALGDRLLAYATSSRAPASSGHKELTDRMYEVEKVAKNVVEGIRSIGDLGYRTLSSYFADSPPLNVARTNSEAAELDMTSTVASEDPSMPHNLPSGMVIIKDIRRWHHDRSSAPVQHFRAHNHRIAAMSFNYNGNLLVTASIQGTSFKVFEINNRGLAKNVYKLSRGYTFANVEDICFSIDSRWLAVSTGRGTTHVFAINPYGGPTNVESHVHARIANERGRWNRRLPAERGADLPSVARIKQKSAIFEADENLSGPPSVSGDMDDRPLIAPKAMFLVNTRASLKSGHRRGSSTALQGCQQMFTFNMNGVLSLHQFRTKSVPVKKKAKGRIINTVDLQISTEDVAEWELVRGPEWAQVHDIVDAPTLRRSESHQPPSRWIIQSELSTHPSHISPLWLSPQFDFQIYDPHGSEDSESFPNLLPTRNLEFRKETPLPYGVYQPRKTNGDSSLSEEDLEEHLSNAMDSKLEIRRNRTEARPIPIKHHANTENLSRTAPLEETGTSVQSSVQSSVTLVSEGRNLAYESDSDSENMYPVFRYQADDWLDEEDTF